MRAFIASVAATLRGVQVAARDAEVHRTYLVAVAAILALTLLLDASLGWTVWHFTASSSDDWSLLSIGLWLARIVGLLVTLVLAPLLAINLCNLLFPMFSEAPFLAGMRAWNPERAAELASMPGLPLSVGIGLSLRRLVVMLVWLAGCLLLGLVPVIGPPLAAVVQGYVLARAVGWEMLDPYLDRRGLPPSEQKRFVQENLATVLGHGSVCAVVLAVPIVGPLAFGLLQAATAGVVTSVLENPTSNSSTAQ